MAVEIEEVGIDVVEERFLGSEAEGDGEAAAEGFDEAARRVLLPDWFEVGDEPTFASSPFEGRSMKLCLGFVGHIVFSRKIKMVIEILKPRLMVCGVQCHLPL